MALGVESSRKTARSLGTLGRGIDCTNTRAFLFQIWSIRSRIRAFAHSATFDPTDLTESNRTVPAVMAVVKRGFLWSRGEDSWRKCHTRPSGRQVLRSDL